MTGSRDELLRDGTGEAATAAFYRELLFGRDRRCLVGTRRFIRVHVLALGRCAPKDFPDETDESVGCEGLGHVGQPLVSGS